MNQNPTFNSFGNWDLKKPLGTGGFGEVILWKNRSTQLEIATKSLRKTESLTPDEVMKLKERWTQENEFMRDLNADFIVRAIKLDDQAFENYLNERHAWKPLPVLIMEYCNGGDLRNHLMKLENLNGLCEFEIREVLRSLRNALDYMHNKHNIQHRDLKPDNIVIHKMGNGKKVYKLTDFGFARYINDQTMLQSVVGTRNYFAPEIVDSSGYTKTVDYWSVGVMTFEMLCGILPFIPHQILFHTINQIKMKPNSSIAITEDFEKPTTFHAHDNIFNENRVSSVFKFEIEKWLRLTLDTDHRTRGTALADITEIPDVKGGRVNKFYKVLDNILNMRILSVFCLNTYRFYYYKVDETTTRMDFFTNLLHDTQINDKNIFFILPVGHSLKRVIDMQNVIDLYEEQWCDTSDNSNPFAMLFIADIKNSFCFEDVKISDVIQYCIHEQNETNDELPVWLIKKFAQDINFLLNNEQRHLVALLQGLRDYAINVEDEIFKFKIQLQHFYNESYILKGQITQFGESLKAAQLAANKTIINDNFFSNWLEILEKKENKIIDFIEKVVINLQTRNESALRRMKEQANSGFFEELIKKDIFGISSFHLHIKNAHQNYRFEELCTNKSACKDCRRFLYDFLEERNEFLHNKQLVMVRNTISAIHLEFRKIYETKISACKVLEEIQKKMKELTFNFQTELIENLINQKQFHIQIDDLPMYQQPIENESSNMHSSINGACHSFDELMEISTTELIEKTQESLRLMSMDMDQSHQ